MMLSSFRPFRLILILLFVVVFNCNSQVKLPVIYHVRNPVGLEKQAVQEIKRYVYLRCGEIPKTKTYTDIQSIPKNSIILLRKSSFEVEHSRISDSIKFKINSLSVDAFYLKNDNKKLYIVGGSDLSLLYGAYHFAELLGVRFYLHDEVIPDEKIQNFSLPAVDELSKPLFSIRGLQPFHDFPEGPDWWNLDDYKAYLAQMTKMRMNFVGFHTYPITKFTGWVKTEPLVWLGAKENVNNDGTVKKAYPSLHFHTNDSTWGYFPRKTSYYSNGASELFDTDNYGANYMKDISPWPHTEIENITIYNQLGKLLDNAFSFAKKVGVKTCLGTETPLLYDESINQQFPYKLLTNKELKVKLYEGVFTRIIKTHPLDYYWFWTPEDWTWKGNKDEDELNTIEDIECANLAKKNVNAPFTLATCGWVLGPQKDRTKFDQIFPKEMPFSCINRHVGFDPIDSGFIAIKDRQKWAIPWMEDDPALISQQLWVGRTRSDAVDAHKFGCNGLIGILWRTENISPQLSALAQAGWSFGTWKDSVFTEKRDLPTSDFYIDWCNAQFGREAGTDLAKIFVKLDGANKNQPAKVHTANLYRTSEWGTFGPGLVYNTNEKWETIKSNFAFIDSIISIKDKIKGLGNQERYTYWLNTFLFQKSMAELGCLLGEMDALTKSVKIEKDIIIQKQTIRNNILPLREKSAAKWNEMYNYLLAKLNTPGELGTIANLEMHNLEKMKILTRNDSLYQAVLNEQIPALVFPKLYNGLSRIIVPTKRTVLESNEDFNLQVMVLSKEKIRGGKLFYSELGNKNHKEYKFKNVARGVYSLSISKNDINKNDFEYSIEFNTENEKIVYPKGAPNVTKTVINID